MTFAICFIISLLTYAVVSLYYKVQALDKVQDSIITAMAYRSEIMPKIFKLEAQVALLEKSNEWNSEYITKNLRNVEYLQKPTFKAATSESDVNAMPIEEAIIRGQLRREAAKASSPSQQRITTQERDSMLKPMTDEEIAKLYKPGGWVEATQEDMAETREEMIKDILRSKGLTEEQIAKLFETKALINITEMIVDHISHPESCTTCPEDINPDSVETVEMEFKGMKGYNCAVCDKAFMEKAENEKELKEIYSIFHPGETGVMCEHCYGVSVDEE